MLDNLNSKQKKIIIAIGLIVLIGIIYFIYNKVGVTEVTFPEENILAKSSTNNEINEKDLQASDDNIIIIHITGAVKKPGIVRLPEGSRIEDAIHAADGLTEEADISNVNLAYVIDDGSKITIPSLTDSNDLEEDDIIDKDSGKNIIGQIQEESSSKNKTVNINKATVTELQTLPGIGASTASKIVEYRDTNGKFQSIEDIKKVKGIGESKYEKIKDYITIK